jgi:hypothetical protein
VDEASAKAGARWLPAEFFKWPPILFFFPPPSPFLLIEWFSLSLSSTSSSSTLRAPRNAKKHSPLSSSSSSASPFTSRREKERGDGKKVPFSCEPLSRRSQSIHFSFSFFFWLFRKNV